MSVNYSIENMGSYLYVTVRGNIKTAADMIHKGSIYFERFGETGIKRALIDFREAGFGLTCYEMVQFAKHLQNAKFTYQHPKVAQLTTSEDVKRFEEFNTIAQNRGHYPKAFTDKKAAIAWLLE